MPMPKSYIKRILDARTYRFSPSTLAKIATTWLKLNVVIIK